MRFRPFLTCLLLAAGLLSGSRARAETPPLLAKAFQQWNAGAGDVAFTQRARVFRADGSIKEERIERFDPSLPDSQRWRLIELNGQPATDEQRKKWEARKNNKARKQIDKSLSDYLDLEHGRLVKDTFANARFEIPVRPEMARLLDVEHVIVVITVEKAHATIEHIGAKLLEPTRVLLGLAKINDFALDVAIEPIGDGPDFEQRAGNVTAESSARVKMSKLGDPIEYRWSEFKRVVSYAGPKKVSEAPN